MFAIIHLGIHWWLAWRSFVVKADTPDDALETYINQPEWLAALSVTSFYSMGLIADFVTVSSSTIFYQVTIRSGGAGQFGIVTGKLYVFHSCSSSSASVCISIQIHSVVGLFIAGSNLRDSPQSTSVSLLQVPSSQHSSLHIELSPLLGRRTFILRVLIAKLSKSSSSRLPFILEFSSSTFPSWFTVASLTDIYRQFLHVPWRVSILGPK